MVDRFLLSKSLFNITITRWLFRALLIIIGITAINILWFIPAIQNIRSSASILAMEVAGRLRSNMEFGLKNSLGQLHEVAGEIADEPDRAQIILDRFLNNNIDFRNVALLDRNGYESIRLERAKEIYPSDVRDHSRDPFFYLALQSVPNFWGVRLSSVDHKPYTTLAVPVKREGNIAWVIIADLNISDLVETKILGRFNGMSYVVDRDGFIILDSRQIRSAERVFVGNRQIVQKVVVDGHEADGLDPEDLYTNKNNKNMFAVGLPIPVAGWGIFVEQPASRAFGGQRIVILFATITWLLGMGIGFVIMYSNYRLNQLNNRLNELLKENYDVGKILVRRDIELTEANTRLMALDASKSEFVSVAAHQLRTPATGIRWSFNALLDRELGEVNSDQAKVLEDGLKSSIRMIDLINDLLNVARIEEGRFGLRFKKLPFELIMQNTIDRHKKAIDEKGILFFLDVQPGISPLNLDEEKISIALDNLFDNAVKYTPPGGTITVKIKEENNFIHVTITDTGIGIPKNQINKLFVKFFRADNAMRFQTSGSGLGLYVVKNVVESHGGAITITSEENKGTTIIFTIPVPH